MLFYEAKSMNEEFRACSEHKGEIVVIKMGGDLMKPEFVRKIASQVAELCKRGAKPVIVHGGKPAIDKALNDRNMLVKQDYKAGMRFTSFEALKVVDEVLKIENAEIVRVFQEVLGDEVKIQGIACYEDLVSAEKAEGHYSGRATTVNTDKLEEMLGNGVIPIINPTCKNESFIEAFDNIVDQDAAKINPNGDDVAMRIFQQMKSGKGGSSLMLCSAINVLDANKKPMTELDKQTIKQMVDNGVINEGMIIKVDDASRAADSNPEGNVFIVNGKAENSILNAYKGAGTTATKINATISNDNDMALSSMALGIIGKK